MLKMMRDSDIFDSECIVLVNPVNCVGVMGAGLAKQFKEKYPDNFKTYEEICQLHNLSVGDVLGISDGDKVIANFATKYHWKDKTKLKWVQKGLRNLHKLLLMHRLDSVAIPKVGCGLGGLNWAEVFPEIKRQFEKYKGKVEVYI